MDFIDTATGITLTPSYHGEKCLGNGEHPDVECCCDECDYYPTCFPEYKEENFAELMRAYAAEEGKRLLEENERLKADPNFVVPESLHQKCMEILGG